MRPAKGFGPLPALAVASFAIIFVLCGLPAIPYAGIQTDEVIFTSVLFDDPYPFFWISVFHKKIPLMLMSYLGTAKAGLYALIFPIWTPSVYSVRVPALVLGALSLPLFYLLVKRAIGLRPAFFATAVLTFDTSYLLASVFDWGPVAIQHICFLGSLLLLVQYCQTASLKAFSGAFFLIGLGMWDKAIFAWMLSGAAIACLLLFPQKLMRELTPKKISLAAVFFVLGALPLIIYNVRRPLATFRGNTSFSLKEIPQKYAVFESTASGQGFIGYLSFDDWAVAQPRSPKPGWESVVVGLSRWTGYKRGHLLWPACLLALAATPLLLLTRWRKPVAFCLICFFIAWAQMLVTQNAGGGLHHVILLWPLPVMLVALAMEALAERCGRWGTPLTAALGTLLCSAGLAATANFERMLIQNGSQGAWTDGIFALSDRLLARNPKLVLLSDWGMLDNVRTLQQGRLRLRWAGDAVMDPNVSDLALKELSMMADEPGTLFVTNTDDRLNFAGANENMRKAAARIGYDRQLLEVVPDTMGRPCFEIFRLVRKAPAESIRLPERTRDRAPLPTGRVGAVPVKQPAMK